MTESWGEDRFLAGVNYPWVNYGIDFGFADAWGHHGVSHPKTRAVVKQDFEILQRRGVQVVRWNLLGDCRAAPDFAANGLVAGFDEFFFKDVDATIELAKAHDISLVFVILDNTFADEANTVNKVQLGGRAGIINVHDGRSSFLYNAFVPLMTRYAGEKTILAWELISEPERMTRMPGRAEDPEKPFTYAETSSFLKEAIDLAQEHATQPVSVGNVSYGWMESWAELGGDYLLSGLPRLDTAGNIRAPSSNSMPVIVSSITATDVAFSETMEAILASGYSGAFLWAYKQSDSSQSLEKALDWFENQKQGQP